MISIEYTDTYGGEANYNWVKRFTLPPGLTDLQAVRRAKALCGLSGVRCKREDWGDTIVLRPHRVCQIVFIQSGEYELNLYIA